ncbi:uncharacterized protein LOC131231885 [Magnolia sinica]|uniref:uncharacterized protein LOC131231885 n=1 Tax=Magnolia sinica TaxID=86752 RepID=UPI00265ADA13|nr:uncharacterized protein LOC131231885 [Magnolia sinica]
MAKAHLMVGLFIFAFALIDLSVATIPKKSVGVYELKKGNFSVKVTNWGAIVISVILPDSKGNLADVALGYDTVAQYLNDTTYFGAIVGRVANRIAGAQFSLNGTRYRLVPNEGKNMLHGGHRGFSKVIWTVKDQKHGKFPYITFTYHSFDGEQGFPGDLDVSVTYKLVGDYDMSVIMKAKARNKPTPVNLAQHTYWNLDGHDSGDILSNTVQLFASHYTPVDKALIPTGQIIPVNGTPYDFLQPDTIGRRISDLPNGYDINYVIDSMGQNGNMKKVAYLKDGKSGRAMELWTNAPGLQFYTSNSLKGVVGKGGYVYGPHGAVCLETQGFPDSVNHPNFPSQIVNPGKVYKHYMLYKFSFH